MRYWILLINICLLSSCEMERLLPVKEKKPPLIKTYSVTSFNTFRTGIITYNNQLVLLGDGNNSTTKNHITFTRIDIDGEIVSSKFLEGQIETSGNSIIETSAGNFIIVGQYGSPGSNSKQKLYVLKVDALGNVFMGKSF